MSLLKRENSFVNFTGDSPLLVRLMRVRKIAKLEQSIQRDILRKELNAL